MHPGVGAAREAVPVVVLAGVLLDPRAERSVLHVVRVVVDREVLAVVVGHRVDQVADPGLAGERESELVAVDLPPFRAEARDLEVPAPRRVVVPRAHRVQGLGECRRRRGPVVGEVDEQRHPATLGLFLVVVLAGVAVVVHGDAVAERELGTPVVDEAVALVVPEHAPQRGSVGQRHVDEALGGVGGVAVADAAARQVRAVLELLRVWLLADDAHGSGHGGRAVVGALRSAQHLDALDVVEVQVGRPPVAAGHRLLVEVVGRGRGVGAEHVRNTAVRHAADVHDLRPGTHADVGDRRALVREVLEAADVEPVYVVRRERLDADRRVLDVLLALAGGDDDLLDGGLRPGVFAGDRDGVQPRHGRDGGGDLRLAECGHGARLVGSCAGGHRLSPESLPAQSCELNRATPTGEDRPPSQRCPVIPVAGTSMRPRPARARWRM